MKSLPFSSFSRRILGKEESPSLVYLRVKNPHPAFRVRKEILQKNVTERGPLEYLDPPASKESLPRIPKKQTQEIDGDWIGAKKWMDLRLRRQPRIETHKYPH